MGENTAQESGRVKEDLSQPTEKGTSFLIWGLIFVTVLNLGMVFGALALFAP